MEPQVKKIFSKLPKTELATEKVKLNVDSELNSLFKKAKNIAKSSNDLNSAADSAAKKIKEAEDVLSDASKYRSTIKEEISRSIRASRSIQNDILKQLQKIEQAAKQLGIKPNDVFSKYNSALDYVSSLDKTIDKLDIAFKLI